MVEKIWVKLHQLPIRPVSLLCKGLCRVSSSIKNFAPGISDELINSDSCLLNHCYNMHVYFNPFTTSGHLQILLCLTPDDFTRPRESLGGERVKVQHLLMYFQNVPRPQNRTEAILAQAPVFKIYLPLYTPVTLWLRFQACGQEKTEVQKNAVSGKLKFTTGRSRNYVFLSAVSFPKKTFVCMRSGRVGNRKKGMSVTLLISVFHSGY